MVPNARQPRAAATRAATTAPGRAGRAAGFTLIEMLVVIGIIVVLIGILVPVVASIRKQAHAAATQAQLTNLASVIQAYHGDFKAFPGPLSYREVYADTALAPGGVKPVIGAPKEETGTDKIDAAQLDKITMSENLVLGLLGGLRRDPTTGGLLYDTSWVGSGPQFLGGTPKRLPPYGVAKDLSTRPNPASLKRTGRYADENQVTARDSEIPEFVDRFPDPMPILYMRARPGTRTDADAPATTVSPATNPLVTGGTGSTRAGQYDLSQIIGYTSGFDASGKESIFGTGRDIRKDEYFGYPTADPLIPNRPHGLRTVDPTRTLTKTLPSGEPDPNYRYPFDLYPALRHGNITGSVKQKDSFILISPGIDRVYGTRDDITNFGNY